MWQPVSLSWRGEPAAARCSPAEGSQREASEVLWQPASLLWRGEAAAARCSPAERSQREASDVLWQSASLSWRGEPGAAPSASRCSRKTHLTDGCGSVRYR